MKLPHFKLVIDPKFNEELGKDDYIAFTAEPAIEIKGIKLNKEKRKFKFNKEKQIVAGPLALNGEKIYRNEDGFEFYVSLDEDVIEKYIERLQTNKQSVKFNDDHSDTKVDADIIYLWIVGGEGDSAFTKYGFKQEDIPKGSAFLVAKVNDKDFWESGVKEQEKFGFSLEGLFDLVPIKEIKEQMAKNDKKFNELIEMAKKNGISLDQLKSYFQEDEEEKKKEEIAAEKEEEIKAEEDKKEEEIAADEHEEEKEEMEEDKKEEEIEAQEDEETPAEEVAEEPAAEVEVIDEEKIIAVVQPKLDEIIAQIAELRNIISESKSEIDEMELKSDKTEFNAYDRLNFCLSMLSDDE